MGRERGGEKAEFGGFCLNTEGVQSGVFAGTRASKRANRRASKRADQRINADGVGGRLIAL